MFELALLGLAAVALVRRATSREPIRFGTGPAILGLLAFVPLWGAVQVWTHRSVYELKTWESALGWVLNASAFGLALGYAQEVERRERWLRVAL